MAGWGTGGLVRGWELAEMVETEVLVAMIAAVRGATKVADVQASAVG